MSFPGALQSLGDAVSASGRFGGAAILSSCVLERLGCEREVSARLEVLAFSARPLGCFVVVGGARGDGVCIHASSRLDHRILRGPEGGIVDAGLLRLAGNVYVL